MGIGKDNRDTSRWTEHSPPVSLDFWRDCARRGTIDEGLKACGLGGVTQTQEIVEKERRKAEQNRYAPKTLCDESEPNKE